MLKPESHRFPLPCPNCSEIDQQLIGNLIGNDEIPCRACGLLIDLTSEEWLTEFNKTVSGLRELFKQNIKRS